VNKQYVVFMNAANGSEMAVIADECHVVVYIVKWENSIWYTLGAIWVSI